MWLRRQETRAKARLIRRLIQGREEGAEKSPRRNEDVTSAAKAALIPCGFYGTAEAVPLTKPVFQQPLKPAAPSGVELRSTGKARVRTVSPRTFASRKGWDPAKAKAKADSLRE